MSTDEYTTKPDLSFVKSTEKPIKPPIIKHLTPFPPLDQRPRYIILDDWHETIQPGVYWCWAAPPTKTDKGPEGKNNAEAELHNDRLSSPIYVDHLLDLPDHQHGLQLRLRPGYGDDDHRHPWRILNIKLSDLSSLRSMDDLRTKLHQIGAWLSADPRDRQQFHKYLNSQIPDSKITCETTLGWSRDRRTYVLPDGAIGPNATTTCYMASDSTPTEIRAQHRPAGTLEDWQNHIAFPATGNPLLMTALAAAFTGPILSILGLSGSGIHFVGGSSTGKTTLIHAARSAWGGPRFAKSWNTTANGLEGIAEQHSDGLLVLDEISECHPRHIGDIIYAIANGTGKQRADRSGDPKPVRHWRCFALSSGEKTTATAMAEGGFNIKTGQILRLIDIPVTGQHGAFGSFISHGHLSSKSMAETIREEADHHYGHAGKAFIDILCLADRNSIRLEHKRITSTLLQTLDKTEQSSAISRVVSMLAAVATAGELAAQWGICPWQPGEAMTAVALAIQGWISEQSDYGAGDNFSTDSPEARAIYNQMNDFISRHGDARFGCITDDKSAHLIRDRAGWWRTGQSGDREYLLTSEAMREALKGHDITRAARTLAALGLLKLPVNKDQKTRLTHSIHIPGFGQQRLYVIMMG